MKISFTFAELAVIFGQVEKVEVAIKQFKEATEKYNKADAVFEDAFAKHNYTFWGAPESLHTMFDEKSNLMAVRDKAERKAYKTIKDFGQLIGIGEGYVDICEEYVKQYISEKYFWRATEMVERVKHLALDASRKVSIYE